MTPNVWTVVYITIGISTYFNFVEHFPPINPIATPILVTLHHYNIWLRDLLRRVVLDGLTDRQPVLRWYRWVRSSIRRAGCECIVSRVGLSSPYSFQLARGQVLGAWCCGAGRTPQSPQGVYCLRSSLTAADNCGSLLGAPIGPTVTSNVYVRLAPRSQSYLINFQC